MQSFVVGFALVSLIAVGSFPRGEAQFLAHAFGRPNYQAYPVGPEQGSVTTADSEAYSRDLQLGRLGVNGGLTRSQSVTRDQYGDTSAARSTSLTKGLNIGKLDLSSTLTGSKSVTDGQVHRSLSQDFNIGKLNIDSSLSRDNLKNGIFGIRRSDNGGLALDLGLLDIDLSRNKNRPNIGQTGTNAQVQAVGQGAETDAISNTNSRTRNFGKLSSTSTLSRSNAVGSVLRGSTSGQASGFAGGAPSYAQPGFFRRRRRQADYFFPGPQNYPYAGPFRPRRQGFGGRRRGGGGFQGGFPDNGGFFGGFPGQNNKANAQGIANSQNPLFEQQAGANTLSQNRVDKLGQYQDNSGSGISSNIAKDGSSGQVSSANTGQQNYQNAQGSGIKDAAQSQSLNFDKDSTQASSSNAQTGHTKTGNSERNDAGSSATANNQNMFGSSTNTAQTKTENYNEGGVQGSKSDSSSQSIFQGANGGAGAANTGANTQSIINPNGFVTNNAASQASSFSNNGGPASASASSSSGFGPNGSFNNAQGFSNTGFGGSNAGARSNNQWRRDVRVRRRASQVTAQPRTFNSIFNLLSGLFGNTNCSNCNPYATANNQNCCPRCPQCNFLPQPLPQPIPPRPPLPPPPYQPLPPPGPSVQITSTIFYPWYDPRPPLQCCPTCTPQIGIFPCGRGMRPGQPSYPPFYFYG